MSNFSILRRLALVFVAILTVLGLGGCGTVYDPCLVKTIGGTLVGAALGAAIGDSRHSAVNGSLAGGIVGADQGCGHSRQQQVVARALYLYDTGIPVTKENCSGVWGQKDGRYVCMFITSAGSGLQRANNAGAKCPGWASGQQQPTNTNRRYFNPPMLAGAHPCP